LVHQRPHPLEDCLEPLLQHRQLVHLELPLLLEVDCLELLRRLLPLELPPLVLLEPLLPPLPVPFPLEPPHLLLRLRAVFLEPLHLLPLEDCLEVLPLQPRELVVRPFSTIPRANRMDPPVSH